MKSFSLALPLLLCAAVAFSQTPKSCGGVDGLIGEWTGAGAGSPGRGTGDFSFQRDLQGKVIVRRSFAEYPATQDRPAYRHDDLMVMYQDGAKSWRAEYWDNEGHAIRYVVSTSPDGCSIIFESPRSSSEAAFRLKYTFVSPNEVKIAFQVAPPGKEFGNYIEASARRK